MSGGSSSVDGWSTLLEPVQLPQDFMRRSDDPRLGEISEFWGGDPAALARGRAVLIGFPQDEGVRRNGGRSGAAEAPEQIRRWLYRLTPRNCEVGIDLSDSPPLDLGNLRLSGQLEDTQAALADVIA